MSGRAETIVAHVEDVDEFDNIIEGTGRYANSVAPSSPAKEQPNTGRARRDTKGRRGSSSPITTSIVTDSDSTLHPRRDSLKKSGKDREKSVSKKALMAASRPPVKHAKTTQGIPRRDESAYYGVDPTITPAISRPRAQTRPTSFYGGARPPAANARFYANQTPGPSPPTSFPPPSWMGPGPGPGPGHGPPGHGHGHGPSPFGPPSSTPLVMHHPPPPPTSDYFARPLESRFGSRPQSSMGFRPPVPRAIEYDDYEEPEKALARRPSMPRKVSKHDDDKRAMPPPRRPSSARPTAVPFRPPPSTPARRRGDLDEHDLELDNPLFSDLSPMGPVGYDFSPIPFRPRPNFGADSGYDLPDQQTEVAGHRRRNSYYGGNSISSGSAYEDKMRQASRYQDDIIGVPQMPLTAETLRKAGKSGTSSRSTKSSGSHDESDYRQSATTRTTAPNNDEDVTIRVKGSTVLKFGNTEMQCQDGAEINITSRSGNPEIRAVGSDRSSYVDQDDRRTRVDQDDRRTRVDIPTQSRLRAASRAKSRPRSFSRSYSKYDVAAPNYEVGRYEAGPRYDGGTDYDAYTAYAPTLPPPPPPPPYPEYPSSYSSRHGEYFGGPPL